MQAPPQTAHTDALLSSLSKLTFTRFVAALMVVVFHFGAHIPPFDIEIVSRLFRRGTEAVQYFFLLSGFVLAVVYASNEPHRFKVGTFWVARLARIYPVYALGLIFAWYLGQPQNLEILLNVTLTQAWSAEHALSMNNPGWSLSVEAFFYLLFPAFLFALTKNRLPKAFIAGLLLYLALAVLQLFRHQPSLREIAEIILNPYFPINNLPFFMFGATLGASLKLGLITPATLRFFRFPIIYTALVFVWLYFRAPLSVLPFCGLILSLVQSESRVVRAMSGKAGVFLGNVSYAMYVLHYPLYIWYLHVAQPRLDFSATVEFYLYIALLIPLSMLVFVLIETPARSAIRLLACRTANNPQGGPDRHAIDATKS